ncbi:APC family permease [Lactobacillus xylocopicola]|uniref:Amino acid permease n=1 Tax=Lactobacillus xylocopicola TaxID=2976676 RepID=A0ABN6SM00_9LACO|nr:amino acid permease [Lactobacillus xylocopicola]BDR60659.1 amino acid permease [Lactobacillus xylocopicola]
MSLWKTMNRKEDPGRYQKKDGHLVRTLKVRDFLALGVGTIVSTSIFTLPGEVAALHTGPAVAISCVVASLVAGLVAFAYAEMAAAMPFAGSVYSWINVIFGEFWGWISGWALLAEYLIGMAFISSGLSANLRALIAPFGLRLPAWLSNPLGVNGGLLDLVALIAIVIAAVLVSFGVSKASRVENILVVVKVLAILLFVVVGLTAVKRANFTPFIPSYRFTSHGPFGGWQGIYAGVSMIYISFLGFDTIASNSAEAVNPQKTMPRGIIGSLLIAVVLFVAVSLVLVGMVPYQQYLNSAEPVGYALRQTGHGTIALVVQAVAILGMFTALIGLCLASSRLVYSFGRDGMVPRTLGKLNQVHRPANSLWTVAIIAIVISAFIPFSFLTQLVSAGTLIAFMFVSMGIYRLRPREGRDIADPAFKMPFYPLLPALAFLGSFAVFWGLDSQAKKYMGIWTIIGLLIYYLYGIQHSALNDQ